MLFRNAILFVVARYPIFEPLPPLIQCPGPIEILPVLYPHVLPIYDILERLSIVNPFKRTQAVRDRNHTESFDVQVSVHASRVISEDSVHYLEELLHTLIQTQILPSLDQQMVVLFIRAMDCQTLWSTNRTQHKEGLAYTSDLDVLFNHRFIQ